MNTRSRSASKAKKEQIKASDVKKEKEEIIIDSEEETEEVNEKGDDDEGDDKYAPRRASRRKQSQQPKQSQPKSAKKEVKPKAKRGATKAASTEKGKKDDQDLEEPDAIEGHSYELDEKEMKEVNHAFDMNKHDDDDEMLTADGLRTAMRSLGFEPRGDEIQKLIKKFAAKHGKVNRNIFHKIMSLKYGSAPGMMNDNNVKDEISRVFNLLDLDKSGFITLDNLRSIAKELNEDLDDDELLEMINEADTDGDQKIDKEDFQKIMIKTNLY